METTTSSGSSTAISFRHPTLADGPAIWQLVIDAGTLDHNSTYAYLLLCRDFGDSCAVAEQNGQLQGFVTGYRPPQRSDVWFLWQVGVAASARGQGLAGKMALFILGQLSRQGVRFLETTVTESNEASRALFRGLARRLETRLDEQPLFGAQLFPQGGHHEPEPLLTIGPFDNATVAHACRQSGLP